MSQLFLGKTSYCQVKVGAKGCSGLIVGTKQGQKGACFFEMIRVAHVRSSRYSD